MKRLLEIANRCKASCTIVFNDYRDDSYETIEGYFNCKNGYEEDIDEEEQLLLKEIIDHDFLIEMWLDVDTQVGSYHLFHWDLDTILNKAIELLNRVTVEETNV